MTAWDWFGTAVAVVLTLAYMIIPEMVREANREHLRREAAREWAFRRELRQRRR